MPCFRPMTAYRSRQGRDPITGRWPLVFNITEGYSDLQETLPCRKCIGCRLDHAKMWATRCLHQASLHKNNCFVTLTYNDENLPKHGGLDHRDYQLFTKKLRDKLQHKIKFYMCGEYGSVCAKCKLSEFRCQCEKFEKSLGRPHFHACIFNHDFKDKKLHSIKKDVKLFRSEELEKIWTNGFSTIGDVTFQSAGYVARYITKKINGKMALEHYNVIDHDTGEFLIERRPEYTACSNGIGKGWYDKFKHDVYPLDKVIIRDNVKVKPPRYYDNLYDLEYPEEFAKIKGKRIQAALDNPNNTPERLKLQERNQDEKFKLLIRPLEKGNLQ